MTSKTLLREQNPVHQYGNSIKKIRISWLFLCTWPANLGRGLSTVWAGKLSSWLSPVHKAYFPVLSYWQKYLFDKLSGLMASFWKQSLKVPRETGETWGRFPSFHSVIWPQGHSLKAVNVRMLIRSGAWETQTINQQTPGEKGCASWWKLKPP